MKTIELERIEVKHKGTDEVSWFYVEKDLDINNYEVLLIHKKWLTKNGEE